MANLLLRYYDIDEGSISIGGTEIDKIGLNDLRSNIGACFTRPLSFRYDYSPEPFYLLLKMPEKSNSLRPFNLHMQKTLWTPCQMGWIH